MFVRSLALITLLGACATLTGCAVDSDEDFEQQEENFMGLPSLQFEEDRALYLVERTCGIDVEGTDVSGSIKKVAGLEYAGEEYPEGFYVEATVEGEPVAGIWSTPFLNARTSECLFVR